MSKIESIFDNTHLGKLTINVSTEEWNKLLVNCTDGALRDEYVKVDAEWNNKCGTYSLPEIGMRVAVIPPMPPRKSTLVTIQKILYTGVHI